MPIPRWSDQVFLDADETYRYRLLRAAPRGRGGRRLVVIGLNPADGGQVTIKGKTDSTIDIVEQWASGLHAKTIKNPIEPLFEEVLYVNLFAWRHGKAKELDNIISKEGYDFAIGPRNKEALTEATKRPEDVVVVMWGGSTEVKVNIDKIQQRRNEVLDLLSCDLSCVGEVASGKQPAHGFTWNLRGSGQLHAWRVDGQVLEVSEG